MTENNPMTKEEFFRKILIDVCIITPSDGWYLEYALRLRLKLIEEGLYVHIVYNHEDIPNNSINFYICYPKIVPEEYIQKSIKSLVFHASELPEGKGFSPWAWKILEGENTIPLSLFEMKENLDDGPIISVDFINLNGTELLPEIRQKLAASVELMCLKYLESDEFPIGVPQVGESSFYPRRDKEDSRLDINKTIFQQFNLLRIVDNERYPAFFSYLGIRYTLKIEKDKEDD